MSFKGKTAIITGAGQGIGFEIITQLCAAGANVVFNDIDKEIGNEALKKLNDYKDQVLFLAGNAGDIQHIDELIDTAVTHFGQLDLAIANAGITTFGPFLNYPLEDFDNLINVNIKGTFFLAQKVANQIIKQNTKGKLLLVSSTTSLQPHTDLEAYGMTKAAITFLAKALSTQLAPLGIQVNCITPGATATARTLSVSDYESGWADKIPNGRTAFTQDIANAALFLLSDASEHIIGQNLIIDGGWSNQGLIPESV